MNGLKYLGTNLKTTRRFSKSCRRLPRILLYFTKTKLLSASYASTFPISIIIQTQLHRTPRPPNSTIFYRRHDVHRSYDVVWCLATTTTVSNRCQGHQLGPTLFVHVVGVCVMRSLCFQPPIKQDPSCDPLPTPVSCNHGTAAFLTKPNDFSAPPLN
jgi:hypothetical protein